MDEKFVRIGPVGERLYKSFYDSGVRYAPERGNVHELTGMEVTVEIRALLEKLKENREQHKKMVAEAREGYVKRTLEMLEEKMGQLRSGKLIRLSVSMAPPEDHSATYDTAIQMLELHTGKEMTLTAGQVRNLVMDEWDWSHTWYAQNMRFSDTAAAVGSAKGYESR
jgi:hypothetical protein